MKKKLSREEKVKQVGETLVGIWEDIYGPMSLRSTYLPWRRQEDDDGENKWRPVYLYYIYLGAGVVGRQDGVYDTELTEDQPRYIEELDVLKARLYFPNEMELVAFREMFEPILSEFSRGLIMIHNLRNKKK